MRVCVRMCLKERVCMRACLCACTQIHTRTHTHTHTPAGTHTLNKHTNSHTHTHIHPHTHTHLRKQSKGGWSLPTEVGGLTLHLCGFFYYHTQRHIHACKVCYLLSHQGNRGQNNTTPEYDFPTITL